MTWSVATPTCVAPCSSIAEHRADHAAHRGDLDPVGVDVRRHAEVVAEQLVGAVDEVDLECRCARDHRSELGTRANLSKSPRLDAAYRSVGGDTLTTVDDAAAARPSSSPTAVKLLRPSPRAPRRSGSRTSSCRGAAGRDFDEGESWDPDAVAALATGARSALLLNLLTEDNLPHYYRSINGKLRQRRRVG